MRKSFLVKLLSLTLLVLLLATACRKDEEVSSEPLPTAMPTAVPISPTARPTAISQPTATAVPISAVDPANIDWPPQVVYSSPAPGEETLLNGAITLRFDQPMNQDSVESAFAVTDEAGEAVSGEFTWTQEDTLVFTPRSLKRQSDYRVQIGEGASGANGRPLTGPIAIDLRTVGYLEVSQTIPANNSGDVDTASAITVLFNRPVVPIVSTGQQAGLPQPLLIDPPLAGQGEWVSSSIYRFTPETTLDGATTYHVSIANGLEDVTGGILESSVDWTFTTRSPEVVSIDPFHNTDGVNPTRPITITFNMPMDRASTEASVLLPGEGVGSTAVSYHWSDNDRILTLQPQNRLQLDTNYQVTISTGARAASGQAGLERNEVSAFRTVPYPAIRYTDPPNNGLADRYQYGVNIVFTSPMDMDTLDGRITIDPEPYRVDYYFNDYDNTLYLSFALDRNATYRVTVPGDAADPYGNTLGQDYTWQFDTPDYDPIASFNLPNQVSQLSTSFTTQVEVLHRNVSTLNLALYDLGLPLNLVLNPYEVYNYNPITQPRQTWNLPLEERNGVTAVPLANGGTLPTGVYLLTVSAPELDPNTYYWQNQRNLLVVADTNLVVKEMFDEVHVWTTDLASGQPVAGRNLTLYNVRGVQVGTAVTDANGFANFSRSTRPDYLEGVIVVSNQPGELGFGMASSNWLQGVSPWEFGLNVAYNPPTPTYAYLYTDRPIYRPGDTVYFKGIVRNADYGRYYLPGEKSVSVDLSPAFYREGESLNENFTFTLNPDGTFDGSYVLPEDIALGTYQFAMRDQNYDTTRQFTVAEYRRPEFLVGVTAAQPEALRGETVDVTVEASYFFGGPAADLTVNWSIYESGYFPNVPGPYYSYGDSANFYYIDYGPYYGGSAQGNYLLGGEGRTDANGRLTITLPADLLRDAEAGSRTVTVEANVQDISNFPVSAHTSVTFHAANAYVGVKPADYVTTAGRETAVDLNTVDWDGQALGNQSVEVIFYERQWQRQRSADAGFYRTIWEPVDTEVARAQVTTDAQGKANASFTPEFGGSYIAVATVTDNGGHQQTSSTYLWVIDSAFIGWRTDPKERRMELVLDKQDYQPGDTAQILVQSPFEGPVQAWLTIERGNLIEQRVVTLQTTSDILDIPIPASYAPNVFVTVTAVKPVTPGTDNPYADIRMGMAEITVSPAELVLNVALNPRSSAFTPGETAVYDIRVTDYQGNPVQASLSLSLVDLAVLTLKADNAPAIEDAFYQPQPLYSQTGGGLFVSGEGLEAELPVEGGGRGGGGGDAAEEALSAAVGDEDENVRRDFPDTAYWRATIETDGNGQAQIEIPLPDTLTTWRLSSKAVTNDTLVGQSSTDIIVSLPLLLRPVTPRFFTVGDVVQIGAIINNNTDSAIEATATLEATGLSGDVAPKTVTVPAHGQTLVRWEVSVDDGTAVDLTFRVSGGGFSDATKPSFGVGPDNMIPVYRYDAEDVVGTSGVLAENGRQVEAILVPPNADLRRGTADVTLSPSLAAALLQTLDYVDNEPYETACAHAIANNLLPNAVTARAIRDLNLDEAALEAQLDALIPQQIAAITALELPGGGWGWCYSDKREEFLSAYILFTLIQAQNAGYSVPDTVMSNGRNLMHSTLKDPASLNQSYQVNRQIFYLYVLHRMGEDNIDLFDQFVSEQRDLISPYAKALLADAYALADPASPNLATLLDDLSAEAIVSATGTHWEDAAGPYWYNLDSDVRNTAVIIDVLARVQPDNGLLPGAVRWLMVARQALHWSTPHETAWSILALTDWMAATGELDARYEYAFVVNLQPEIQGTFTRDTILATQATAVPLSELAPDAVNYFEFRRGDGNGRLYYTLHLDSYLLAQSVSAVSRGVTVRRAYYDAACDPQTETCDPISEIAAGQQVRVELTIIAPNDLVYAVVRDPIPAGAEAIDPNLDTSASGAGPSLQNVDQAYRYGYWGWWYFNRTEFRDEEVVFFAEFLPAGTYQYTYTLQANIPGDFQVMPATARQEMFPEVFGRSDGLLFTITQ
ncbi:MAG: Ig-like domain-containing protein [Ardenticatenaceae bacterium]|nr:Ig-like domain-containing protein [Ardenticatenaceae bacterium]